MVTLLKALKWSPDGCRIETLPAGEHEDLPPRVLEIAEQLGILNAILTPTNRMLVSIQPNAPAACWPTPRQSSFSKLVL